VSVEVQFPAVSSPSDFMLKRLWFEYTQLWTRKYSQTSEERRDGTGRSLWQLMEELQLCTVKKTRWYSNSEAVTVG